MGFRRNCPKKGAVSYDASPNGLRQPRVDGLVRQGITGKALERILTRKACSIPATRLHAVVGGARSCC
jgi:hypothetical protein